MEKLFDVFHSKSDFPSRHWYGERNKNSRDKLKNMLQSKNYKVARLAAVSLISISRRGILSKSHKQNDDNEVFALYWNLAQNREDTWQNRYIEGISYLRINWSDKHKAIYEAIINEKNEKVLNSWSRLIERAQYITVEDRNSLFSFLENILENKDKFHKKIRLSALKRLNKIISEIEPVEISEEALGLPLMQR